MKIQRKRWIVVRDGKNGPEVFCGLARHFTFKPISDIGDTAIKTYRSKAQADAGFRSSWSTNCPYRTIPVMETVEEISE